MTGRTHAAQLAAAAEAAAKKSRHQKFHWCRLDNDFIDMAVWRVVAERLEMPLHQVQAFAVRLESFGNAAIPRGYVGDFKATEFAAALGMSSQDAARIYAELEHDEIGWVLQEHIATFWQRNPDKVDASATERQQRKRARDKALRDLARAARLGQITEEQRHTAEAELLGLSTGHAVSRVTHRDSVTVTPQHSRGPEPPPVDNSGDIARGDTAGSAKGRGGEGGASPQDAEAWLEQRGVRLVVERMQLLPSQAATRIERWKRELGFDAEALALILDAADQATKNAAGFHVSVTDQISRRLRDAEGPRLPLVQRLTGKLGGAA